MSRAAADPGYRQRIEAIFGQAGFVNDIGIRLLDCGPGWCETTLDLAPRHLQHNGYVHAGVQTTQADHSAGAAGSTLLAPGEYVLSLELKINLLRAARGERLWCRAEVLKPGSRFSVVESAVWAERDGQRSLVSKATVTLAVLQEK